ncbi:hypothetical protein EUGRSUZ_J01900 [Eucalyptus grandis]|uniref:Uncharacterized protein n=2 Tax=Eucalyptus grandis TaxID=71139 RepID=A0ACC3J6X9_EUCGR|nr:hypothetical protein EUGRSUZ_J01900 [Eucalyptus grandis]
MARAASNPKSSGESSFLFTSGVPCESSQRPKRLFVRFTFSSDSSTAGRTTSCAVCLQALKNFVCHATRCDLVGQVGVEIS